MKRNICWWLLILVWIVSCRNTPRQNLAFSVLIPSSPFTETSPPEQEAPKIMIVTSQKEIVPPMPEYLFSDDVLEALEGINFDHSFAILLQVGQISKDDIVNGVTRENGRVVISVKNAVVGPGNFKLLEYSLPYQVISVEKTDKWEQMIEFIVEDENGNLLDSANHYVP